MHKKKPISIINQAGLSFTALIESVKNQEVKKVEDSLTRANKISAEIKEELFPTATIKKVRRKKDPNDIIVYQINNLKFKRRANAIKEPQVHGGNIRRKVMDKDFCTKNNCLPKFEEDRIKKRITEQEKFWIDKAKKILQMLAGNRKIKYDDYRVLRHIVDSYAEKCNVKKSRKLISLRVNS